jgi:hypothetical protein
MMKIEQKITPMNTNAKGRYRTPAYFAAPAPGLPSQDSSSFFSRSGKN